MSPSDFARKRRAKKEEEKKSFLCLAEDLHHYVIMSLIYVSFGS